MKIIHIALNDPSYDDAILRGPSIWLSVNFIKILLFSGLFLLFSWIVFIMTTWTKNLFWHGIVVQFSIIWALHLVYLWHVFSINRQKSEFAKIVSRAMEDSSPAELFDQTDPVLRVFNEKDRYYVFGEFLLIYDDIRSRKYID